MADPVWPVTNNMPQDLLVDGLSQSAQETVLSFEPSKGPEMLMSKFTAASEYFDGRLVLTLLQLKDLKIFYEDTCKRGPIKFDWKHPILQTARKCRLRSFNYVPSGTSLLGPFEVQIRLEVLP